MIMVTTCFLPKILYRHQKGAIHIPTMAGLCLVGTQTDGGLKTVLENTLMSAQMKKLRNFWKIHEH